MLKLKTFPGGVRLREHKELTAGRAIRNLPPPSRVILPLRQNVGHPPRPIVETGQEVKLGQVVAVSEGTVSSTLHASLAGRVVSIEPRPYPAGPDELAIEIEGVPGEEPRDFLKVLGKGKDSEPETLRRRVLEAGIVGLGGAEFPTQVKLAPPPEARIEYAVINGAECEPFLTVDHRLLLEETAKVIAGLRIIMRATGAARGVVAVEANKKNAFRKVKEALSGEKNIRAELLKVKYPQGAEKQLLFSLFGRRVPAGGLPSAVGCVVQNVQTAIAIAEAVGEGKPLIERVVTVTGPDLKAPGNLRVRLGTPLKDLLAAAGGLPEGPVEIIAGGPMMGIAQCSLEAPVIKGTSGLLVLKPSARPRNLPCIRCGKCLQVCPMGLSPSDLATAAEKGDKELFRKLGGDNCIECGCCAYVCSAGRDLVQLIQLGKAALKN